REVFRLLADVTFGGGLLKVAASTVAVSVILTAAVGVQLGLEGYQGLHIIGLAPLAGFLSAFGNTRELAPLITAFGLAAQMGCKFTAQLGAMRVTDEIDAIEVMAIPSLPYLITTRVIAALVAVVPLYLLALSGSYLASQITVTAVGHQAGGTYQHYFHLFLNTKDVFLSVLKVVVFAILVTVVHCYYGYTASGGPEGVGRAAGRAIRATIVLIAVSDMLMTILFWGTSSGVRVSG
ncbi:MAG: ABC transporter permease, partial [Acidimicrobiales bacterium]